MIGGRTTATLRVVAEHADLWNIPGGDLDDCIRRSALLDRTPRASRSGSPASSSPRRREPGGRL
jgi:hypothetical protein